MSLAKVEGWHYSRNGGSSESGGEFILSYNPVLDLTNLNFYKQV